MLADGFVERFEQCRLGAGEFDHAGHVFMAWWYLRERGLGEGTRVFVDGVKRFASHHGAPGKYHDTLTRALLQVIHARVVDAPQGDTWDAFRARNGDLFSNVPALLAPHYSPERLAAAHAREHFAAPDRAPLPHQE